MQRLPSDFGHLSDRHGAEFGDRDGEEEITAGRLHLDNLRIDTHVGGLVGILDLDHRRCLVAEPVDQPLQVVLAEIVVLIEHGDLAVGLVLQDVGRVDAPLRLVADKKAHGPGMAL